MQQTLRRTPSPRVSLSIFASPILFIAFFILLISRQPHVLTDAQLWGDDGWSWYPDAYRMGLSCLALPVNGYLNTVQRLVGLAVLPLPLLWVPPIFAFVGLSAQALMATFLCGRRMDPILPARGVRVVVAVLALLLPNEIELYGNLTNTQWNLAILAALIVVGPAPRGRGGWAFDVIVLMLSGLSGPFALLLGPTALLVWLKRRDRAATLRLGILAVTAAVQVVVLLMVPDHGNLPTPLGASAMMLARMLARHVVIGIEAGYLMGLYSSLLPFWASNAMTFCALAVGVVAFVLALVNGPPAFRGFALFALLVAGGGLIHPHASATGTQWEAMTHPPNGNRYFAMLCLTWLAGLVVLACSKRHALRAIGIVLLLPVVFYAIPVSWRIAAGHSDFNTKARAWATAAPGTKMAFPQMPPGNGDMVLIKH